MFRVCIAPALPGSAYSVDVMNLTFRTLNAAPPEADHRPRSRPPSAAAPAVRDANQGIAVPQPRLPASAVLQEPRRPIASERKCPRSSEFQAKGPAPAVRTGGRGAAEADG